MNNLKDLKKLAFDEKNDEIIKIATLKLMKFIKSIKQVKLIVFYQEKMMILTFISRYMQVPVVQKAKIGQIF